MTTENMQYAGFWKRLAALLLDFVILLPLILTISYLSPKYRLFHAYYLIPGILITFFYSIYLVKRYGGTPGKIIIGIQIIKTDGNPVTYREAILRSAPDLVFWVITSIGVMYAIFHMTDSEYISLSSPERHQRLYEQPWLKPINLINQIWVWSEFIVLLTNRKKRALHDFLAGTVVIQKP